MAEAFRHDARGRNRRTLIVLAAAWAGLLALWLGVQAAGWIVAGLGLTTLPALWDILSDRRAGLRIGDGKLHWFSGARAWEMPFDQIDHLRLDTRLDFSVRASAVTPDRRRIRLSPEALPHHKVLEDAARAHGLRVERHHFSLL